MNVLERGLSVICDCRVCGQVEDDLHTLLFYPVAAECWHIMGIHVPFQSICNIFDLILLILNLSDLFIQVSICGTLWSVWIRRNGYLW